MGEPEKGTSTGRTGLHRDWRPSLHSGFGTFVVLAPVGVVVTGVVLDRAGYSAVGIAMTLLGAVSFLAMLAIVAWWG